MSLFGLRSFGIVLPCILLAGQAFASSQLTNVVIQDTEKSDYLPHDITKPSAAYSPFENFMEQLDDQTLPPSASPDDGITQDFDALMEAISEGINEDVAPPSLPVKPDLNFEPIENVVSKPVPAVTNTQATGSATTEPKKEKKSFLGRLFGGEAVSYDEAVMDTNPDAVPEEQSPVQVSPFVQDAITRATPSQPIISNSQISEDYYPPSRMSSLALRKSQADAMEYQELIQSLTTKIQLLENEKQSLRQALHSNHRVLLP